MGLVIRCDACKSTLDRSRLLIGVQLARGTMRMSDGSDPRFIASSRPAEFLLCESCAGYVDRCIDVLTQQAELARRAE